LRKFFLCKNERYKISLKSPKIEEFHEEVNGEDLSIGKNFEAWTLQVSLKRLCIDATTPTLFFSFPFLVHGVKMMQFLTNGNFVTLNMWVEKTKACSANIYVLFDRSLVM
jgi:hypothetical protein